MKTKTLKLITLLVMVIVGLSACSKSTKETTDSFILPEGLKDCKLYNMYNGWTNVQVMRCPNSATTTSYQSGKTTTSITLLEEQLKAAKTKEAALNKLTTEEKQALGLESKKARSKKWKFSWL